VFERCKVSIFVVAFGRAAFSRGGAKSESTNATAAEKIKLSSPELPTMVSAVAALLKSDLLAYVNEAISGGRVQIEISP
jgi:hypothetical protein